tara:strand:- start:362 stop:676 length:315 start_codon:yes stop_codon:yes gene_type:complete
MTSILPPASALRTGDGPLDAGLVRAGEAGGPVKNRISNRCSRFTLPSKMEARSSVEPLYRSRHFLTFPCHRSSNRPTNLVRCTLNRVISQVRVPLGGRRLRMAK